MYTPFIERPQVIDNDYYIPLPTVTRKYIDRPSDSILDAIESMHFPSSTRQENKEEKKTIPLTPNNTKNTNRLKIDTDSARLAVTCPGYDSHINENLIPEINSWLSKHNEATHVGSDIMAYMSNHSNKELNI